MPLKHLHRTIYIGLITTMSDMCILLIDDHAMFRTGLSMVLKTSMKNIEVLEAGTLNEGMNGKATKPDVILLDIKLPGLTGMEGIEVLRHKWPQVPVVILSSQDDPETAREAVERGAARFVSKAGTADEIISAILQAMQPNKKLASAHHYVPHGMQPHLTPRQCEVLDLVCQGMSNKVIGRRLSLSENTVRGHVQAILAFLQVSSRTEAAFAAHRKGLVG